MKIGNNDFDVEMEKPSRERAAYERGKAEAQDVIYDRITAERERQDAKWGYPQVNTFSEWAGIIAEETGELCAELNELNFGRGDERRMVEEAIHVAAVAVSIIEHYDIADMVTESWRKYRDDDGTEDGGVWIYKGRDAQGKKVYECPACHAFIHGASNFCKECGAKMAGVRKEGS